MIRASFPNHRRRCLLWSTWLILLLAAGVALAQGTAFTYQGRLTESSAPATGVYDFQFKLYDANGTPQGPALVREDVQVSNGAFTVQLDFGQVFDGNARLLEIGVRPGASTGEFTLLAPRQAVTSTPYAIQTLNAAQLGGVAASQYVKTDDARLTDARAPTAGNTNYIQNTTTQQAADFNIAGNGTAGGTLSGSVVNAATRYNIGGNRVLNTPGMNNIFAGVGAGQAHVNGRDNAFFGHDAGLNNAGNAISGNYNSFFGSNAGKSNTSGGFNSFFGSNAGLSNLGNANVSLGSFNSFFGTDAGLNNTGNDNSFFGTQAGNGNTTGERNAFFGRNAGSGNVSGSDNTVIGANAAVIPNNLTNATAIGAGAVATQSNSIVLGNNANVGIGTTDTAFARLSVVAANNGTAVSGSSGSGGAGVIGVSSGDGSGVTGLNDSDTGFAGKFNGHVLVLRTLSVGTTLKVGSLGVSGGTQLCLNGAGLIAACSSSLRYKTEVRQFSAGLEILNRLRPITFTWKSDHTRDLGLGAEDVAAVEPLLVTRNDKGEIEGVKYDRLSAVLINAVKEQQAQIEQQQNQLKQQQDGLKQQQSQIESLKKLVCLDHPQAEVCKLRRQP